MSAITPVDELSQLPVLTSHDDSPISEKPPSFSSDDEKKEKVEVSEPAPVPVNAEYEGEDVVPNKGERVIRSGKDVSAYLISDRDDGDACFTFRSVTLGFLGSAFQASLSQIYNFKPTSVGISGTFLAIIIFLIGNAWAFLLPTRKGMVSRFGENRIPAWLLSTVHFINPGHFGLKEHAIAAITASSASNGAQSTDVLGTQKLFFTDIPVTGTTAALGVISIGLFGYGLAGIMRPILVYPSEMVYWGSLPMVDLFQAFHWEKSFSTKRVKAFWYSLLGMSLYEAIPAYMFPTLNSISIPCFASMHAPVRMQQTLTNIFGGALGNEGMGLLSLSFDWQYITSAAVSYPLIMQANMWVGILICYAAMVIIYYQNFWNSKALPFMSTNLYTANGSDYNQTAVFVNGILDKPELDAYGYPYVTGAYAWSLLTNNAAIGGLVAHVILFYGKQVLKGIRESKDQSIPDRHYQATRKYPDAPAWWYYILLGVSFIFGLIVVITQHTTLPVWGYIIALLVGTVVAPFSGVLYAILGTGISTGPLTKMIAGALIPGRPLANLYFFGWSHSTIAQAINLSNDLKLGQYLKIPPRAMFITQVLGTVFGAFLNYAVASSIIKSKFDLLLSTTGSYVWSGAYYQQLNASAVTWSMVKYMYGPGTSYFIVPMATLVGMAIVIAHWVFSRFVPKIGSFDVRDLNLPIIMLYSAYVTVGQNSPVTTYVIVGFISQAIVRTRYPGWFKKFNYVIGAGLDGGSLFVIFILSFAVFGAAGPQRPFPTVSLHTSHPLFGSSCPGLANASFDDFQLYSGGVILLAIQTIVLTRRRPRRARSDVAFVVSLPLMNLTTCSKRESFRLSSGDQSVLLACCIASSYVYPTSNLWHFGITVPATFPCCSPSTGSELSVPSYHRSLTL